MHQLERLSPAELAEARRLMAQRFGPASASAQGRIALVGLRGAGKTTLGQLAAQALGVPFVELDREIERASGMELSEIFAVHGQAMFRRLERQCLETIVARFDRVVIATGGSLVTEPATYDLLLSTCFVVWLSAKPDEHMGRVLAQGDLRPMADGPQAMDDLKAILESRTRALRQGQRAGVDQRQDRGAGVCRAAGRHPARRCRRRVVADGTVPPVQCLCVLDFSAAWPGWWSKPCGPMAPMGSTVASTSISPAFSNRRVNLRRSPSLSGALRPVSIR